MHNIKPGHNKVLVTGATGFTGSHVVRAFLHAGWKIDVLVRPGSSDGLIQDLRSQIAVHVHDGTTRDALRIVTLSSPTVVVHIASKVVGDHVPDDVNCVIDSNVLFGTQMLEAMSKSGVKCFINTGTYLEHCRGRDYNPVGL